MKRKTIFKTELFQPTFEDMIYTRKKTIGVNKLKFKEGKKEFMLYDVGGQRNERKKWTSVFDNVSVVFFVASLSDYDLRCYEDDVTNRMMESIELFEKTINNTSFINQKILLIFTKKDLFAEKIQRISLKDCFDDYGEGNDHEQAFQFILRKYLESNKGDEDRITHLTVNTTSFEEISKLFLFTKKYLSKL